VVGGEALEEVYAVYEDGVLRPVRRLNLPEGVLVEVRVRLVRASRLYEVVKRYSSMFEDVEEDPLEVLLGMRER